MGGKAKDDGGAPGRRVPGEAARPGVQGCDQAGEDHHQGRQADSDFSSLQDNLGDNLWFSDISASSLMAL